MFQSHKTDRFGNALRFFMVKATTTRMIAFDFDEALSFEGDSGPYLQYSAVRARNIRRRLAEEGLESEVDPAAVAALPAEVWADDLWDLALATAMTPDRVRAAGAVRPISLDLTSKCNLRCTGCYYYAEGMDRVDHRRDDEAFDALVEAEKARGTNFVTVVGGEPARMRSRT